MRKITKTYVKYLAVAYLLLAVLFVAFFFGYISYMDFSMLLFFFFCLCMIFWGYYYMIGNETYGAVITLNFFVGKKNRDDYDTERMTRDMGKYMIITALVLMAGVAIFYFTFMFELLLLCFVAIIACTVVFFIVCRKSKYLKDPSMKRI